MWGGRQQASAKTNFLACISGGSNIFASDEAHELRCKTCGGRVNVVMQAVVFSKAFLCKMLRRSGVSMPFTIPSTKRKEKLHRQ